MSSSHLQVIIIGGGVGGLCLGQGLKAAGIDFAIYERQSNQKDWLEGYRIHINPVGSKALHACLPPLLWEVFLAITGKPSAGFGFLNEQLKELVVIPEQTQMTTETSVVEGHYPVSRLALRQLLLSGIEDKVCFDKTFERFEQTPDGKVTVYFEDGTSTSGDMLIGADGANSRVCKQYLPQAKRVETGQTAVGGKLRMTDQSRAWVPTELSTRMNITWPPNENVLFNAVFDREKLPSEELDDLKRKIQSLGLDPDPMVDHNQDYILWAFIASSDTYPSNVQNYDPNTLMRFVMDKMKGWHPALRRIIAESDPSSLMLLPFKASVPIGPWTSSNVTVLGDAIHNMTPVLGLGANMALRDASLLASKLKAVQQSGSPLVAAISEYEREMRAYGFDAVNASVKYSRQVTSDQRFTREAAKIWFRICKFIPALRQLTLDRSFTRQMRS